jgi:hypothetical protein
MNTLLIMSEKTTDRVLVRLPTTMLVSVDFACYDSLNLLQHGLELATYPSSRRSYSRVPHLLSFLCLSTHALAPFRRRAPTSHHDPHSCKRSQLPAVYSENVTLALCLIVNRCLPTWIPVIVKEQRLLVRRTSISSALSGALLSFLIFHCDAAGKRDTNGEALRYARLLSDTKLNLLLSHFQQSISRLRYHKRKNTTPT